MRRLILGSTDDMDVGLSFGVIGWPSSTHRGITYIPPIEGTIHANSLEYWAHSHRFMNEGEDVLLEVGYQNTGEGVAVHTWLSAQDWISTFDLHSGNNASGMTLSGSSSVGAGANIFLGGSDIMAPSSYLAIKLRTGSDERLVYDPADDRWDFKGHDVVDVGSLFQQEQASAGADVAGWGQVWVKNNTPNELWFTDDAGNDTQISMTTGAWSPELWDDSLSGAESQAYTSNTGEYWVIGKLCFARFILQPSSLGTLNTGQAAKVSLPPGLNAASGNYAFTASRGNALNLPAAAAIVGRAISGYILLQKWSATAGTTDLLLSEWGVGGQIIMSGWYELA